MYETNSKTGIEFGNFLPRGTSLKNTGYIYGLVVYTGYTDRTQTVVISTFGSHESKVMLNSISARAKKSRVDLNLSKQVLIIFLIQVSFLAMPFGITRSK